MRATYPYVARLQNKSLPSMDEVHLIAACKKQDRKAQKIIYETYTRTMFGICLRYTSDEYQAKDLLQDGFIKIFSNIQSYEGKGSFEGWMKRVFVNLALENIRRNKHIIITSDDIQEIPDQADELSEEMYDISAEDLMAMIQELPVGYATVFNLYAIEDYSHKEIAGQLNISEGTSRSQYARARKLLQEKVVQYLQKNA